MASALLLIMGRSARGNRTFNIRGIDLSFTASSPIIFAIAAAAIVVATLALIRRPAMPAGSILLWLLATALLCMAAAGLRWALPGDTNLLVMVDVSASTRGASYRDPRQLDTRLHELLGHRRYRTMWFAEGAIDRPDTGEANPTQTTFPPLADASAIVLFSDGRFEPPSFAPPVFAVLDPALDAVDDAAITDLFVRGEEAIATVRNQGATRALTWSASSAVVQVPPISEMVFTTVAPPPGGAIRVAFSAADRWPENDVLETRRPIVQRFERWWVGSANRASGDGWTFHSPAEIPSHAADYLGTSVVVLDDVSASSLTDGQQHALAQYVRQLGGGLLLLGGDHSFGAGGYFASAIEPLSPLASAPPEPRRHWAILVDGSGSMAGPTGLGTTRWQVAIAAAKEALKSLPPQDSVDIGEFAREVRWWLSGTNVETARASPFPPAGTAPRGPTNLGPAFESVAASMRGADRRIELLVITDADARIDDPISLASTLREANITMNVVVTSAIGTAADALRSAAIASGGSVEVQADPARWPETARALAQRRAAIDANPGPVDVTFLGELSHVGQATVSSWNEVWPRSGTRELAEANLNGRRVVLGATWEVGTGRVAALAYKTPPAIAQALASRLAIEPRDPQFAVRTRANASGVTIEVDAIADGRPLNELALQLRVTEPEDDRAVTEVTIPQVGPGRYSLRRPSQSQTALWTVMAGNRVVDRFAVAGRYLAEFERIGNDRAALAHLAERTGGRVIEPTQSGQLALPVEARAVDLTTPLATSAAALIAVSLIHWRRPIRWPMRARSDLPRRDALPALQRQPEASVAARRVP